jgi:hypothetical protein
LKTQGPVAVTFVSGLIMLISFYFGILGQWESALYSWSVIVAGFAALLGIANLTKLHVTRIQRRKESFLSYTLLVVMWGIMIYGFINTQNAPLYTDLFEALYTPVGTTTMSLLAFFIFSAAYRAFRPRSLEATIMLICSFVTILGRAPAGALIWKGFPVVTEWLVSVPANAGSRGIMLAAALGGVSMSLRVLLGIERRHFGGGSAS